MFIYIYWFIYNMYTHYIIYTFFFFNTFAELLILYGQLYLRPSGKINRVLVARIIHTLTRGYCFQTDGLSSDMFIFFSKAMQCARYVASVPFVC